MSVLIYDKLEFAKEVTMIGNLEIFFANNPDTPPKKTADTEYKERNANWNIRINKAKE